MKNYNTFSEVYSSLLQNGFESISTGAIVRNQNMEELLKSPWEKLLMERFRKYHIIDGFYQADNFNSFATVSETQRMQGLIQLLVFDTNYLREQRKDFDTSAVGIARSQMNLAFNLKPSFWTEIMDVEQSVKRDRHNLEQAFEAYKNIISKNNIPIGNLDLTGWFNVHQPYVTARTFELLFVIKNLDYLTQNIQAEIPLDAERLPVFMFWDQGYDEAPKLVQVMIDKARLEFGSRLVLITRDNIDDFVEIPTFVEKIRTTKRAFFSDWLRVSLLAKHGGVWIDSTVMVTEGLNQQILKNYSDIGILVQSFGADKFQMSSWFLAAYQKNNYVFQILKRTLDLYINQYDFVGEYFIFHSLTKALAQLDKQFNRVWLYNDHLLSQKGLELEKHVYDDWQKVDLANILKDSHVHKLSYHAYDASRLHKDSLYQHILDTNGKLDS